LYLLSEKSKNEVPENVNKGRLRLPTFTEINDRPSIFKTIKDLIGQDITKISIPVTFNEPISMLQKVAEIMEYQDLLIKANQQQDSIMRLAYVAAIRVA
jgi:hypothetical protein